MEAFQLGSKAAWLKETPVRLTNMENSGFFLTVMGRKPRESSYKLWYYAWSTGDSSLSFFYFFSTFCWKVFKGDQSCHGRFNKAGNKDWGLRSWEWFRGGSRGKEHDLQHLKGIEAQAYEELMKSLKGERQNIKIDMMFNRGTVKLPRTDVFCGWSLGNQSKPVEAGKYGIYWRPFLRFINICVSALLWEDYIHYFHPARK